jgi:hypothetical protein
MPRPPDNLGMFGQAPGANRTWQNLPMPAARGTAVTNQPPVQ